MKADTTLFSRFLALLGVRHTADYSDARFREMPFQTLFGMQKLLEEYGVQSWGFLLSDKNEISSLPVPFVAPVKSRMIIVTSVSDTSLHYNSVGVEEEMPLEKFLGVWGGVALVASPGDKACEPDYARHRFAEVMTLLRNVGIWAVGCLLFAWFFITRSDIHNWGSIAMIGVDLLGLWLSFLLVQKTLGIKSKHGDAVCRVLEPGGCDRISKSDASKFLGIFHWSEVGLTYFSVGLVVLLLFPEMTGWLAGINILALPYTLWSISYQKFVAKTWCTLCVGVQLTLWLQFIVFLLSGWVSHIFPLGWNAVALVMVYVFVMLVLNAVDVFILSRIKKED